MAEVTLFKNHHGTVQVCTTKGTFPFVAGRFFTTDEELEKHFKILAERGEHGIYIDPQEKTIDPNAATPMEALKKKIIAEHEAAKQLGGNSGITESEQAGIQKSVVSTADSVINGTTQGAQQAQVEKGKEAESAALKTLQNLVKK